MRYKDPVYGNIEITEPVILELIKSKPVQRLKDISQHGASIYNKGYIKRRITRFEHSVGVYILLEKFECSQEEQIAGLLHDVGHTVFSHVIDYLFVHGNGEYDKINHQSLIRNSEIPEILRKYNLNVGRILDEKNFSAMERPLPNICADRIDYFLRDYSLFKKIDEKSLLNSLAIYKGGFVFNNKKAAFYFATNYINANDIFWRNHFHEFLYFTLVDILKIALSEKIIDKGDLFLTEKEVMIKIKKSKNQKILKLLNTLENIKPEDVFWSYNKALSGYRVKSKARVSDPPVLINGKVKKLSEIDTKYKNLFIKTKENYSKDRWIGFRDNDRI